jgi:hypothetical protein
VTFSEGPLASSHTRDVTITNNQSVKLDLAPTAAPGPVTTISPAASAVVTTTGPRFTWRRPVVGTDRYRVQISTDAGMTALVVNDSTIADTTAVFSGLVDGTTYYWRVQAHNGAGWGELAAPQSFRVVMLPAAVTLVSPADDGRVPRDNALFTWSRPSPTVTAYAFELANDAGFTSIVASDTAVTDTSYLVTSLGLDRYFWRVRAKNAAGWGPYSEVREVEAATSGVDGEAGAHGASELGVAVYPNPAAATTTARVDLPRSGRYGIDLVDALGRVVFDVTALDGRREWPAGSYEIMLDLNTLQQGLYFVRVTAEDGTSAVTPVRVVTGR